jgi:hypothetical protein
MYFTNWYNKLKAKIDCALTYHNFKRTEIPFQKKCTKCGMEIDTRDLH